MWRLLNAWSSTRTSVRILFLGLTISIVVFHACKWRPVRMIERLPQAALITVWQPSSSGEIRWAENQTEQHLLLCLHVQETREKECLTHCSCDRRQVQQQEVRRFSDGREKNLPDNLWQCFHEVEQGSFYLWPSPWSHLCSCEAQYKKLLRPLGGSVYT